MTTGAAEPIRARLARGRGRQREIYGEALGDRVRELTAALGISQGRLARALGLSPAMLSQLVSARRIKIGDPAVLARLQILDQRWRAANTRLDPGAVDALLAEVAAARWRWTAASPAGSPTGAAPRAPPGARPTRCAGSPSPPDWPRRPRCSVRRFPRWPRCCAGPRAGRGR